MTDTLPPLVALVPDLMDRSRVSASVRGVRFVPDAAALRSAVSESGTAAVVLVDLARPGVLEAVTDLTATGVRVVGFGSHVDTELLERARAAGAEVHPRSRLFRSLAALLAGDTG